MKFRAIIDLLSVSKGESHKSQEIFLAILSNKLDPLLTGQHSVEIIIPQLKSMAMKLFHTKL